MTDSGQPAGWYPAEGDPPGTQRYWDGMQWQGGPQPIAAAAMGAVGTTAVGVPAEWGSRAIAAIIDWLISLAPLVVFGILGAIVGEGAGGFLILLGYLASFGVSIWNLMIKQGSTGQSIGKEQRGIKLVSDKTGQPVGGGMAFVRWLVAQAISAVTCGIGGLADILWPLFDKEKKRLTDKILSFSVINA